MNDDLEAAASQNGRVTLVAVHALVVAITVIGVIASSQDSHMRETLGHSVPRIWLGQTWRLLTSIPLSTNPLQMLGSGVLLLIAGSYVEERWGAWRLLFAFVVCGVAAGVAALCGHTSCESTLGGAVTGLLGATLVVVLRERESQDTDAVTIFVILGLLLLLGWEPLRGGANLWPCAGGFLSGLILGMLLRTPPHLEIVAAGACLVVLAQATAVFTQCQPQVMADYCFAAGLNAYQNGDLITARLRWTDALTWDDRLAVAHYDLGQIYLRLRRYHAYQQEMEAALQLEPANPDALSSYGHFCMQHGTPAAAEKYYRLLVRVEPQQTAAWLDLATAQHLQGHGVAAAASLNKALELEPRNPEILYQLARLYDDELEDSLKARPYWKLLAEREGDNPSEATARACLALGQAKRAAGQLSLLLQKSDLLHASVPPLLALRARALAQIGLFGPALQDMERAAGLAPSWSISFQRARLMMWWRRSSMLNVGRTAARAGFPLHTAVQQAFQTSLAQAQGVRQVSLTRGFVAFLSDVPSGLSLAQRSAQQALTVRPQDAEANYLLGLIWEKKGDARAARDAFRRAAWREVGFREYCEACGRSWPPLDI